MKVDRISFRLNDRHEKKASTRKTEENEQEMTKRLEDKVIRSLCSLQKRVGPPEYRKWRRIHGLQLPLHPQQVIGWFILLIVGGATFSVMIPALRPLLREGLFIVLGTLFGLHIFSHLTALLLDPADPELRALNANFTVPEFDRSKHTHVIENGRCHLCNIKTTSAKTKHCSVCNKCIDQFDHHCKWLNHCIGGRNYVPFLICVASAVAASLVVVGVSVLEIVYYHVDPNLLAVFPVQHNETAQELFLPDSVFLGIVIVLGLLAATTAGLLLHLCLFHCYISILGVSTYEYIRNYRQPNDGLQRRLVFGSNCCDKRNEVMSNHIDQSQYPRTKYKDCCYNFWSRPPEVGEDDEEGCSRAKSCFSRTKYFLRSGGGRKKKPLKRQSTDPEFVDKIIKPFLITLNEEKGLEALDESKKPDPCFYKIDELKNGKKEKQKNSDDIKNEELLNRRSLSYPNLRSLCPKIIARSTIQNNGNSVRIKTNQIRPTSAAEDFVPNKGVRVDAETCSIATIAAPENILPALNQTVTKVQSSADLRRLENVLDLIDGPHYDVLPIAQSIYRTTVRKKVACARPRSPLLSPIKESGLSNPGSPRLDLVCSSTHVFVRPPTPETATIFLSNSNSLSSSSDDDCEEERYDVSDDNSHTPSSHFEINRRYRSDEILETPQLPRKVYSGSKGMKNEFWRKRLGAPRLVVAPMVDASELAWRLLSRRHGAQLCYTPMFHSLIFVKDERYRKEGLMSVPEDRPLIVQFCGNDADIILKAALLAEPYCDAVDINLGCPQAIAKRGHYGAFLQDDWPLLEKIVGTLKEKLVIPVTCKIRIYEDIGKTVEYAKMLERAGCQLLTVHGRTKEQKGPLTGLASWLHIKAVKENVSIPVFANGNIQSLQDVYKCIEVTKCDGVMSAEGILYNPAIFESRYPPSWEMALEYLELVEKHPCPLSYIRGHLFKIFHHVLCLPMNKDVRYELANKSCLEEFRNVTKIIKERFEPFHEGLVTWKEGYCDTYDLNLPPWLCKPYERPSPEEHVRRITELQNREKEFRKLENNDNRDDEVAAKKRKESYIIMKDRSNKKKYKRLARFPEKANSVKRIVVICTSSVPCPNPMGLKCDSKLCKTCCKNKCYEENKDCLGHGILIKTRREKAKHFSEAKKKCESSDTNYDMKKKQNDR